MHTPSRRRGGPGYSLVELTATLAVAGALLALAAPSFVAKVHDNRITTQINLLLSDIQLARMEAVTRSRDVVLCRSRDGTTCHRSPGPGVDWSEGWIVYVNPDRDGERDPAEPLLRVRSSLPGGLKLHFNQWWRVTYRADGGARNGTFTLCDFRGPEAARTLVLYYTGRPRVSNRKADGNPVVCN